MAREQGTAKLFWLTVATALALGVLGTLGTWQLERRAWKEALLEQISDRTTAEPIILDAAATLLGSGEDLEYTPVRARGRFLHDKAMFYYASGPQGPGSHVYTPLVGASGVVLLVNRGFLPEAERGLLRGTAEDAGQVSEVIGLLRRPGRKALFTPANDAGRNLWYWRDLDGMANQAFGAGTVARKQVLPFFIEAVSAPVGSKPVAGTPRGGVTRLELPNRHLEYAVTWYGLGMALIGVYLAFVWSRRQSSRERLILGGSRRRNWGKT